MLIIDLDKRTLGGTAKAGDVKKKGLMKASLADGVVRLAL